VTTNTYKGLPFLTIFFLQYKVNSDTLLYGESFLTFEEERSFREMHSLYGNFSF